ncbi:hypothetical protein M3Y94_00276400 [Aphelenchoides besseyi]|nr:hypothetical protein M3Y94_00276400 [Aphelenchoides besseyi]KAI6236040.1 hypothetical protein M3Y95_00115200 [Aphelenchoides besseyi]
MANRPLNLNGFCLYSLRLFQFSLLFFSIIPNGCLSYHRSITSEMMFIYKQRVRRAEPDCSNEAETNADLQQAIGKMITGNDAKGYLMRTQVPKITNDMIIDKSPFCDEEEAISDISPDTPIRDRALCAFQYVENYNKQRLPQTIPEVQCLCSKPTNKEVLRRFPQIHCEAIFYDVPVLKFENTCAKFRQTTERISLACVPVLSSQSTMNVFINTHAAQKAELPTK